VRVGGGQFGEEAADGITRGGQHGGAFFGGGFPRVARAGISGYLAPFALRPGPALTQRLDAKLLGLARPSFG
jgi:hypothetical protein